MTFHWEFKYFFSCTSHCHSHDASRLLCQPEYAAPPIHPEVVQPFVRDHIHGKPLEASSTSPGLPYSPVGTWGYLSACVPLQSPRPEGVARWLWPKTARSLPAAAVWCSKQFREVVFETFQASYESEVWNEKRTKSHFSEHRFWSPWRVIPPAETTALQSKLCLWAYPSALSLCSWNLGSSITKFCTSPFSFGVNLHWECTGGLALTSPLPAVGSSMSWLQRTCRAGAQFPSWLCSAPHSSFTILSYSAKEALTLLRDNLLSACPTYKHFSGAARKGFKTPWTDTLIQLAPDLDYFSQKTICTSPQTLFPKYQGTCVFWVYILWRKVILKPWLLQ